MGFVNGSTYRFVNKYYTGHALNVYGTNAASTGRNVCLYANTPSDIMQKWVVRTSGSGYRMHSAVNNNYVLDRSDGSLSNSYANNAHLCSTGETSTADSQVKFEYVSDNVYKIRLISSGRYLTATNSTLVSGLPASSITTATALSGGSGGHSNVYWASASTSTKQQWTVSPNVDGGVTPPSDPYAALNWSYVFSDSNNAWGYWGYSPTGASNSNNGSPHVHWGIDVICNTGTELRAPAAATVFETGSGGDRGNYIVLKMNQTDPVSGRSMYVRFLHMRDPALITTGSVAKNKTLGYVGNSGTVTPHLHLDINTLTSSQASGGAFSAANTINPVRLFPNISFPSNYYWE